MSENIGRYNVLLELITKQTGDIEKIKKEATGLQGIFNRAKGAFAGIFAAQVVNSAIGSIQGLIGKTIELSASYEQTKVAFDTFLGDSEKATEVLNNLNKFSIETPFEPDQVNQAGKSLLAFGLEADELIPKLTQIGDISSATGKDFNELAVIFGKAKVAGTLFGEDINQLTEAGIPVIQEFAKQLGVSESQVKKLASEGKISFSNLEEAFKSLTSEGGKFEGLMLAQSKTFGGLVSSLRGAVDESLRGIGDTILPLLKPVIEGLIGVFTNIVTFVKDNQENITSFFQNVASVGKAAFDILVPIVIGLGKALFVTFKVLADIPSIVKENRASFVALGAAIIALNTGLIINTATVIKNSVATRAAAASQLFMNGITKTLTISTRAFNAVLRSNPIGLVVTAVAALVIGFQQLYKRSETVRNITAGVVNVFKELYKGVKELFSGIKDLFGGGFLDGFKNIGTQIKDSFSNAFKELFSDIENIVSGEDIKGGLLRLGQKILKLTPLGWAIDIGKKISKAFVSGFDDNQLKEQIEKTLNFGGGDDRKDLYKKRGAEIKKAVDNEIKEENRLDETKKKSKEDIDKENFKRNEETVRRNFALREQEARQTITDAAELSKVLEKIELEKQIALLTIKRNYTKNGTADAIELENAIAELEAKYLSFLTRTRQVDILKLLPTKDVETVVKNAKSMQEALSLLSIAIASTNDVELKNKLKAQFDAIKSQINGDDLRKQISDLKIELDFTPNPAIRQKIKEEIQTIEKELVLFQGDAIKKLVFEQEGFQTIDLENLAPQDRVVALQNRLANVTNFVQAFRQKVKDGNADPLEFDIADNLEEEAQRIIDLLRRLGIDIPKESEKVIEGRNTLLGLSTEEIQLVGDAVNTARDAFSAVTDIYIQNLDKRLDAQRDRVAKATEIAEKGNVEQLQLEQARLDELEDKRRKAVERQAIIEKAAAQAQIIINTALTISNLQAGASKAGAATLGVGAPIFLALMGGLIASAANLFKPPSFKDGIEFFSTRKDGRVTGPGTGRSDSVPAWLSNGERVVDAATNKELKDVPNKLLPKAVKALELIQYPFVTIPKRNELGVTDMNGVITEISNLRKAFESMKIETKLDADGFSQRIIREFDKVTRRKSIRG